MQVGFLVTLLLQIMVFAYKSKKFKSILGVILGVKVEGGDRI